MSGNSYSYVVDNDNKPLSPTKESKAWYMIRKGKAVLVSRYPMTIRLFRVIPKEDICKDEFRLGIDDGSLYTGIAVVQKGKNNNIVVLKGTIEHRNDVIHKMKGRKTHRFHRRQLKRHRECRYLNRTSHKRCGLPPSIKQKKQATIRVIDNIKKFIPVTDYYLEDVAIDIRALTDGYKPYKWQYQKSNRLDENLRKSIIIRDNNTCQMCGKNKGNMEVHHILPKRLSGTDTVDNLITLCHKCHTKVTGRETKYIKYFYNIIHSEYHNKGLNYASHVMIGKNYLRNEIKNRGKLFLTTGGDTANKRYDWKIEKSHSNDAICITDLKPQKSTINIKDWIIRPIRKKCKAPKDNKELFGFRHRDYIRYSPKNGEKHEGYITALYPKRKLVTFQTKDKTYNCRSIKSCKLLYRFSKLYWL